MIWGPAVFICDECVSICNEVIVREGGTPSMTNRYELEDMEAADSEKLLEIARIAQGQAAPLDSYLNRLVEMLRARGVTWARIGEALGVSRQAAWMRFSNEE